MHTAYPAYIDEHQPDTNTVKAQPAIQLNTIN
jgi:hypothetical protein